MFPETGDLAYLGPPQIAAAKYAIKLINEAGGINGQPVPEIEAGDEANDAALASQAATKEINDGVNAILGAAATGMTMAIIDKVVAAGVAECSGSNTGVILTDYKGKMNGSTQLYYRTAPSDALQGPVLGNMVLADGHSKIAIVARADDYGKGLAKAVADAITAGGGTVVMNDTYDPKATDFSGLVQKIKASNPDAVVTVSFAEGFQLWKQLFAAGLTPKKVGIYGADGMRSETAPKDFPDPSVVDGAKGTAPASADNPDFIKALQAFAPELKETQFAPQVYDCTNIFALAAEQAKSSKAMDWAKDVEGVTKGGTECTTFADCKKLIDAGTDIHYVGASGDLSFTDKGEPGKASVEMWEYENGGKLVSLKTVISSIN
ncbi:MAG: ABC transporter substrate-binding protein [Nakamurella sp.]